jgi:U3 small nucleolar RNA-associated protein 20
MRSVVSRLLSALVQDLRTSLSPFYSDLLKTLLLLAPRGLLATTLQTLLSTLSSLFRYILISTTQDTSDDESRLPEVEPSWEMLKTTLDSCNDDGVRMLSEVWGSVLRRLKGGNGGTRDRLLRVMVSSMQTSGPRNSRIEDSVALAISASCKVYPSFLLVSIFSTNCASCTN